MGNFNQVCAVSNTPISEGQEARVFFLVINTYKRSTENYNSSFSRSHTNPHGNYKVIGYPLLGRYNYCNQYDFDNYDMAELNLEILNKKYIYKNKSDVKIKDLKSLQSEINNGTLNIKTAHGDSSVVMMAIHESIYQDLILRERFEPFIQMHSNFESKSFSEAVNELKKEVLCNKNGLLSENNINELNEEKADAGMIFDNIGKLNTEGELVTKEGIDDFEKETSKMLINMFKMKKDDFNSIQHTIHTNYKKDCLNNSFIQEIIEGTVGVFWIKEWFHKNHLQFHSPVTTNEIVDYRNESNRLFKMAKIISKLKTNHEYEEDIELKITETSKLFLSIKELEEKFGIWFNESGEEIKSLNQAIEIMKESNIKSFYIGGKIDIDLLCSKYELLTKYEKGTLIYLEY